MKKRVNNKSTGRDYSKERAYEKKTTHERSLRNTARREKLQFLTNKYGAKRAEAMMKGMDVDHDKELRQGGSNHLSNLKLVKTSINRSRKDHPPGHRKIVK